MPLTCAHLVGSLPYPDGETGERARWIYWQRAKVAEHPAMEVAANEDKARILQWDGKLIRE